MTKKKRELIEILLDSVKPEDWPKSLPYAAQDKSSTGTAKSTIWLYQEKPVLSSVNNHAWNSVPPSKYDDLMIDTCLCKHWNKTIVHRDEFMKRWNECIHSDQTALLRESMPPCSEEIPCHFVDVKEKKYLDKVDGEFVGIEKVISDRGNNYGRFEDGAEIMQQLKLIAHTSQGWERMKPVQREAVDMILHKVGRILNGDPAYIDSWVDIEGYSNLVSSWLKGESK